MKTSSKNFYQMMSTRRSIRKFKTDPVDLDIIKNAVKAAGTAPSGANRQPWYFVVVTQQELKNQIKLHAEEVEKEFYQSKNTKNWVEDLKFLKTNSTKDFLSEAPILILVFMRTCVENIKEENKTCKTYYPKESTGLATGILITALHQSGLGVLTHTPQPMCFLNEILNLDKTYVPYMILVTGHPSEDYQPIKVTKKNLDEICEFY